MKKLRMFVAMFGVMALVLGLASLPAAAGVVEITSAADAHVRADLPTNNFGGINNTLVHSVPDADSYFKAYLKFDVSSVDLSSVTAASFEWTFAYSTTGTVPTENLTYSVYGLNQSINGDGWDEGTITWNNALVTHGNGTGNTLAVGAATLLGQFTIPAGTAVGPEYTVSSSAAFVNWIKADTDNLVTLIVLAPDLTPAQSTAILGFAAKEYDKPFLAGVDAGNDNVIKPMLTLTTLDTPIAEPSSLGLLGLALLGLRKRRN